VSWRRPAPACSCPLILLSAWLFARYERRLVYPFLRRLAASPILFFRGWLGLLEEPMLVFVVAAMIGVSPALDQVRRRRLLLYQLQPLARQ
jgi:hypothetical protein